MKKFSIKNENIFLNFLHNFLFYPVTIVEAYRLMSRTACMIMVLLLVFQLALFRFLGAMGTIVGVPGKLLAAASAAICHSDGLLQDMVERNGSICAFIKEPTAANH